MENPGKEITVSSRTLSSRTSTIVLGGLLLIAAARPLCAQPSFTGIGDLPGGLFGSIADSVSMDGKVVTGSSTAGGFAAYEPIRWDAETGISRLDTGWWGHAVGTNGSGSVAGGWIIHTDRTTTEAYRWTASDRIVGLGDLPGGEFRSTVQGVNARGDILVGSSSSERSGEDSGETHRWTAEAGMVGLGDLPGGLFRSGAGAMSADGLVIVGGGRTEQGLEAYRWTEETGMIGLGNFPDGSRSAARTVSADGSVVVGNGFDATHQRAFRWTEQTGMVALEKIHPDQILMRAYDTSWDGNVIVGEVATHSGSGFGPFYWTPEDGVQWLTDVLDEHGVVVPDGWHLGRANAVSADGRTIIGSGINPDGAGEGWVAYLGPGCRADFDDNGVVDAEDVAAYLTAWLDSNIFTDWNYDGSINTRDLLGFLNEWVAKPGCE